MKQPFPEADSAPALLYAGKCSVCHPAYHPKTHTYTGWKKVIPRMEKLAEDHGIKPLYPKRKKPRYSPICKNMRERGSDLPPFKS